MVRILFLVLIGLAIAVGVNYYLMSSPENAEFQEQMIAALPETPSGWQSTDEAPMLQSFGDISATRVTRTYTGEGSTVALTITRSAQAVVAAEAAGRNVLDPQMAALRDRSGPQYRAFRREDWKGWTVKGLEGRDEATIWYDDLLIQVTSEPSDRNTLDDFLDGVGWETLNEALAPGE